MRTAISASGANSCQALPVLPLAGCQLLDSGTRPFRARGGRVVLSGVAGSVAQAIELTRLDKQPGVVVAD